MGQAGRGPSPHCTPSLSCPRGAGMASAGGPRDSPLLAHGEVPGQE